MEKYSQLLELLRFPLMVFAGLLLGVKRDTKSPKSFADTDEEIDNPTLLADSDSCFSAFNDVQVHYKICDANSNTLEGSSLRIPMILLHGFGASIFSWENVMKTLAKVVGSKVLAYDRPAFGLTSREKGLSGNPYSESFSTSTTLHFIDLLDAEKVILVGHSAGALVALDTYYQAPKRVAALILVAPAIPAPLLFRWRNGQEKYGPKNCSHNSNPFCNYLLKIITFIMEAIGILVTRIAVIINILYNQTLSTILLSKVGVMAIRAMMKKFGISIIRWSWYDPNQVSHHILQGYTKPMRIKGWDVGLAEYAVAMFADSSSKLKPPVIKRLENITCPVMIVTGDTDRLTPSWNSIKLSQLIPDCSFELIKNCGHLPHEEKAEEFIYVVDKFMKTVVFGTAEESASKL